MSAALTERARQIEGERAQVQALEARLLELQETGRSRAAATGDELQAARQRMRELEADLQEAEDELDARDAAQERAQAMSELLEAASTHRGGGSSAGDPSRPGTGRSGGEDAQRAFSLVRNGRHREVQELFDAGRLFPDTRDAFGNTVLIVACQNDRKRIAKAAVKHGVPLNA